MPEATESKLTIDQQLERDRILYGNSFERRWTDADGKQHRERIDPLTVKWFK